MPPPASNLAAQITWLFVLAIPIATVARTVVFEEVFREFREVCQDRSQSCRSAGARKFFYVFTCEYCLSHWVTIFFLWLTGFRLLLDDWRGVVLAFFALPLVANAYLNFYGRLRLEIHRERVEIKHEEKKLEEEGQEAPTGPAPRQLPELDAPMARQG